MVQQFSSDSAFNPSGNEHNYSESAIVFNSRRLPYFIELRTTSLTDVLNKFFSGFSRKSIANWISVRTKPGFYYEFDKHLHIAFCDQRDGHGTQYWWLLFFDDFYKKYLLEHTKVEVQNVKSKTSKDNDTEHQWGGLNFRSKSEVRIAHALYEQKVLFFANPRGFMDFTNLPITSLNNKPKDKVEVDFLVFKGQRSMILEVDGLQHNKSEQANRDYMRDRVLLRDGIPTVRFKAQECYNHPIQVVEEFLNLFDKG